MPIPDDVDKEKLSEVALAIMWLGAHGGKFETRVWKGIDWELTDLLHERGWISDPRGKAKSVVLSECGEKLAGEFLQKHFGEDHSE